MAARERIDLLTTTGAVLAPLGVIVAVVFLFQPWRTCADDDVAAACAMHPADATVMALGAVAAIVGVLLLWIGAHRGHR
ncbi:MULTISPECIES: hypothetical protein [unclassified Rathayibacter]|uniref:hypothetical protein n=1 Tax=unclassified Rathayibacter TaxID=2609250 RepID=UPI00104B0566|nr:MULTISPECIES: hypothetical protein [unclassified Rathayibacter]MCJ1703732.1 hypothetical protein [Rathayibacter sp. VKM Ac-2926]TCL83574.1 hypothetical protein EDF49_1033 [Rathayibacter sp. PhB192]TCM29167.1 hypothetical protein EDF43_1033 [Rathayibacter sp. PhB179]